MYAYRVVAVVVEAGRLRARAARVVVCIHAVLGQQHWLVSRVGHGEEKVAEGVATVDLVTSYK